MIKDNILRIRQRIASVCARINRDPAAILIVAVSKARTVDEIEEATSAGVTDIGENRVQEALAKYNDMRYAIPACRQAGCDMPIRWHMVGHLQTNKVKDAVRIFDVIQSVDSIRLAQEIDKQAAKINKIQDILIEVKTSGETAKFGLDPEAAVGAIKEITKLKNINLKGLMTIAPLADNPEKARPYFQMLKKLRDGVNAICDKRYAIRDLSMGMTDDFEVAIEEGATMVRLGRAIFE